MMKQGIISAGNYIIDRVKTISHWPVHGTITDIVEEKTGGGGGAYNVIIDLAKLQVNIPLYALGMIGDDSNGHAILNDLQQHRVNTDWMVQTESAATSYTDVMSEKNSPYRTFFHCRGANALLDVEHFTKLDINARIFFLGYLLLLDRFELPDKAFKYRGARILDLLRNKGYRTAVDLVTVQGEEPARIAQSCLPFIDYLIVNEYEAANITGLSIRLSEQKLDKMRLMNSAAMLMEKGVNELVVIHFPEGAYALSKTGQDVWSPSFRVNSDEIAGTTGAGDAFCSGLLWGLHEEKPLGYTLKFAHACARYNLMHETATGGAVSQKMIADFIEKGIVRKNSPF